MISVPDPVTGVDPDPEPRIHASGSASNADPDAAIFAIDLQDANKKLIFTKKISAYYFLKLHSHHFSKR
jgi:hypothetical protein